MKNLALAGVCALALAAVGLSPAKAQGTQIAQTVVSGIVCPTTAQVNVGSARPVVGSQLGALCVQQAGGGGNLVSITPTVQNAAYSSGNCVGGFNPITISNAAGQSGFIMDVKLSSIGGATTGFTVYLFSANPAASTCTDKSTFTLATADVDKLIEAPFILVPAAPTGTTSSFAEAANLSRPFIAGGSSASGVKTVYVGLVANGAVTPASTTDLHLSVGAAF